METIVQVVTMKTLVPALLAVLLLAGCAVNKPLPVEPVKLAGMEFYPMYETAGYGLKCNTFSSRFEFNYICLGANDFYVVKMYDGNMAYENYRLTNLKAGNDKIRAYSTKKRRYTDKIKQSRYSDIQIERF